MFVYGLSSSESPELIRYIGITTQSLSERLSGHRCEARRIKISHKINWIKSLWNTGNKLLITLIEECTTKEELCSKEIEYIKLFKSFGCKLLNKTIGGEGINSPELRKASSERCIERNKTLSKQVNAKRVYAFDYKTKKYIGEYSSCTELAKILGVWTNAVSSVAKGEDGTIKGLLLSYNPQCPTYVWKQSTEEGRKKCSELAKGNKNSLGKNLSEEHKELLRLRSLNNKYAVGAKWTKEQRERRAITQRKKVFQYDLEGNFIKEWLGYKLAAEELNINYNMIVECVGGRKKKAGGFIWKKELV